MAGQWPPSPSVEDEDTALSREFLLSKSIDQVKSDNQPAPSRGSIDQYPIILDNASQDSPGNQAKRTAASSEKAGFDNHSSDESSGPSTPPPVNKEQRFVLLHDDNSTNLSTHPKRPPLPKAKSSLGLGTEQIPRGRPQVAQIRTDVGNDLQEAITGRRRAASPYSYKPQPEHVRRHERVKSTYLNPSSAESPIYGNLEFSRSATTTSEIRQHDYDGRDRDNDTFSSKPKSARPLATEHRRSSELNSSTSGRPSVADLDNPPLRRRKSRRDSSPVGFFKHNSSSVKQSPIDANETIRKYQRSRGPERKNSKDSVHTSSNDESFLRKHEFSKEDSTSPRISRDSIRNRDTQSNKADRRSLHKEESENEASSGPDIRSSTSQQLRAPPTPSSVRRMEDYFENALQSNLRKREAHGSRTSANPSPFTSPPSSPPRTPRLERKPKDYFGVLSSVKQTSRPPSIDETFKDVKQYSNILNAATAGTSYPGKGSSSASQTTLTPLETPSSGAYSRQGSEQRSRRPTPVFEEARSTSRAGSYASSDELRGSAHNLHQDRPVSRDGVVIGGLAAPPQLVSRAHSYSSTSTHAHIRPPSIHRAVSNVNPFAPALGNTSPVFSRSPTTTHVLQTQSVSLPPPPRPQSAQGFSLPQCPRSRPVHGMNDWYTIQGISNLDICPTCMGTLGNSSFRHLFIPSFHKPLGQPVMCAMSQPWIRIAWLQSLKQNRNNLELVQSLTSLPANVYPCAGVKSDVRRWYHLEDPKSRKQITNFHACAACVRSVELIFPEVRSLKLFIRPEDKLSQEQVCNLNCHSKHFRGFINGLDKLAGYYRVNDLRQKDIQEFVDFASNAARHRECAKDSPLSTQTWHFMPDLPEMTICEECFDEVIWPMKDKPLAREISKTAKLVPAFVKNQSGGGISCQMYSDRMRQIFQDASVNNDFEGLRTAVRLRYEMHTRIKEMLKLYEQDQKAGIDRRAEIERNNTIWRTYE